MNSRRSRRGLALLAALAGLLLAAPLLAQAVITQRGNLRVKVSGKISPQTLPRQEAAPIAVSVAGQVSTVDQSLPPQLQVLKIEINRNGRLDYSGLPVCTVGQIQPATDSRALAACRSALVGEGTFSAYIALKGQEPYPASGRLLLFNGRVGKHEVVLGHIYISRPFASSFVITFDIGRAPGGSFGTVLTTNLAQALGSRRYLTGIEFTLRRHYRSAGAAHSYLSAACPAPSGFPGAVFPLARTTFTFAGGVKLASVLAGSCKVRG